jgi:histidyl-tRNA synthetase
MKGHYRQSGRGTPPPLPLRHNPLRQIGSLVRGDVRSTNPPRSALPNPDFTLRLAAIGCSGTLPLLRGGPLRVLCRARHCVREKNLRPFRGINAGRESPAELLSFSVRRPKKKKIFSSHPSSSVFSVPLWFIFLLFYLTSSQLTCGGRVAYGECFFMQYTIPKGVFDVLPVEPRAEDGWRASDHWQFVEGVMRKVAHGYGFAEIRTPIFEKTELFQRSVGETSDIVSKEMYTFEDRGGRSLSLRPEGTASVARAFVENKLHVLGNVHKFFYIGPMFRYERQQAGRFRQHHQFGAEAFGIGTPEQDVEMIDMLCELYRRLGLKELSVCLNSVGDVDSRAAYCAALQDHLRPHFESLSPESQARFQKNVLRILDSKDLNDQKLLEGAPSIQKALSDADRDHFAKVCALLKRGGIPFRIEEKLVRGLDYYNRTVFEVVSGALGAHNTIGAGGRYDGMLGQFGGTSLPAVGFATGIERVLQTMVAQGAPFPPPAHPTVFVIPIGEAALDTCFELTTRLRHAHIAADIDLSGKKVQNGLQRADKLNATFALIIGDEELKNGTAQLKQMHTRESEMIPIGDLVQRIKERV